jgi:hypothetical protein
LELDVRINEEQMGKARAQEFIDTNIARGVNVRLIEDRKEMKFDCALVAFDGELDDRIGVATMTLASVHWRCHK